MVLDLRRMENVVNDMDVTIGLHDLVYICIYN